MDKPTIIIGTRYRKELVADVAGNHDTMTAAMALEQLELSVLPEGRLQEAAKLMADAFADRPNVWRALWNTKN